MIRPHSEIEYPASPKQKHMARKIQKKMKGFKNGRKQLNRMD